MQIRVGLEMSYVCPQPTPMILALRIHYSRAADLVRPDHLPTQPAVPITAYRDIFGIWRSRLMAPQGDFTIRANAPINDTGMADTVAPQLERTPVEMLPAATLAITLCRCMNIPARNCIGYLGGIGVAPVPRPMAFAAWFEAHLGDRWYTFDARNNTPRIARGRDACDVAPASTFGPNTLQSFKVRSDEVAPA